MTGTHLPIAQLSLSPSDTASLSGVKSRERFAAFVYSLFFYIFIQAEHEAVFYFSVLRFLSEVIFVVLGFLLFC